MRNTARSNALFLALMACSRIGLVVALVLKKERPGLRTPPSFIPPKTGSPLPSRDLKNVFVFLPRNDRGEIDVAWQEKLADKVRAATRARTEARAKLEAAKALVEDAMNGLLEEA